MPDVISEPISPPLLDVRGVSFAYGRGATPALADVSLGVRAGTTVGIIGPNGGGKTTLLKLILGLLAPTRGTITIDGLAPRDAVRAGRVGYLPQASGVAAARVPIDARQLVALGLAGRLGLLRGPTRADMAYVDELLEDVGLADKARTPISELSGGQLQRALIARALAPRPALLLLDEPTIGIDRRGQRAFIDLLGRLRSAYGVTILFVSHDLRAVTSASDRIACVSGRIHYHDVPERLPADVVDELFACDLDALGIDGTRAARVPLCADPGCDGRHHEARHAAIAAGADAR